MEIWLILNGKRSGPYPDYEIRSRIEHGQMEPEDKVWHDGLAEWTPVGELELFRMSFDGVKPTVQPPPLSQGYEALLKQSLHLGRRFWARWMDLTGYSALWWLGMYLGGRDIGAAIGNPWLLLTMYLPWFAFEAWLIHRFGRTPGKWLMGLKVVNEDGSPLTLKLSMWRALRVLVTGIGFGWFLLSILCHAMCWFTTRRIGKPIWDHIGNHKVEANELNPFKIIGLLCVYVAAAYLIVAVVGPYSDSDIPKDSPEYKEFVELRDRWFFPLRK